MKVVIAGGTGFIGRTLARKLSSRGHEVCVLTRQDAPGDIPAGARALRWNPQNPGDWTQEVQRADAVVNLCGAGIADGRWTKARRKILLDSRVEATRALADAVGRGGVLINASAVGFYGYSGDTADEKSPKGRGFLADICEAWENEARRAEQRGARVVLLRIGVVLGKNGGALAKMLAPFKLGLGGRLGSGRQWFPWVHEQDLAGLIEQSLADARYRGPVNAVAPEAVDNAVFTKELAGALRRPAVFPVPGFALKLLLGEMSQMLLEGRRVNPTAALANGYQFKFPTIETALKDVLGAAQS